MASKLRISNDEARAAVESDQTAATVLRAVFEDRFGTEVFDWDPETVVLECRDEFDADMSSESLDRWSALQLAMTSDAFFSRLDGFSGVSSALASGDTYFDVFKPLQPEEAAWAVVEISMNRDMLPFAPAIKSYLRRAMSSAGYRGIPPFMAPIFSDSPGAISEELEGLRGAERQGGIEEFILGELDDLRFQLSEIGGLRRAATALETGGSIVDWL